MSGSQKTIVATGVSSGIGLDVIRQLLAEPQPYRIILGARDVSRTKGAVDSLDYDRASNSVSILQLDCANLKEVKTFAAQALSELGAAKVDYLLLCAGMSGASEDKNRFGSEWCECYIVNHLSGHYLTHLLQDKLVDSKSRIVFVSSGAVRNVSDVSTIEKTMKAGSGADVRPVYAATKFTQLLAANWWRRQLAGKCNVVAVSPGLIPGTGLAKGLGLVSPDMPDAKPVPEGAQSIIQALKRSDFPADPEQIFLTSWGEWWPKDVYGQSLDRDLQERFSPSKEQIESQERVN